uniref:Octopamine receptor beta-2R-like n=1 Tax=Dermatophagoides pteronyssinus TaxID=6956 RepID=A0A6P6Y1N5_DERPT|nr:octopamine receptor beta-2R-like [Dermatophagoides pteronyssinus]
MYNHLIDNNDPSSIINSPVTLLPSLSNMIDSSLDTATAMFTTTINSISHNLSSLSSANSIIATTTATANSLPMMIMNSDNNEIIEPMISDWIDIVIFVLKLLILGTIIFSAIFGNLLVIIAVFRHHRLRITTNYFIVSLAFADILVALFAMTFNASVVISKRWIFNQFLCDFWNSCDVLFSTASIMHLSCISYDRYYAIIKPLDYPMKVTGKRVAIMLTCVWILSALISYIPIFTGIYTTAEAMEQRKLYSDQCEWVVNIPYALISSTISFWLPCSIMLSAYYKIYREAIKQEKFIYRTQQMANQTNHHHLQHQKNRLINNNNNNNNNINNNNNNNNNNADEDGATSRLNAPKHSNTSENNVIQIQSTSSHRNSHCDPDPESGSSTPTKRTISKMKREHKAAKTLGIIMGAFILCWLPFFIWYVVSTIMNADTPTVIVHILFWVGYLNSAMNPIIYAYFNREFREAFKETLRNIFCRCCHLKCLESQRNDAISFSCTYRSTMDVNENKYLKD